MASAASAAYYTIEQTVGNTPLVRLQRLQGKGCTNHVLLKLEGNNPAGSVKDRPALSMIQEAEKEGRIKPGDTLIEATSGACTESLSGAASRKPQAAMPRAASREPLMHAPRAGNTGIALAMAASIKGYKMKLIMPSNMSEERRLAMSAYGAQSFRRRSRSAVPRACTRGALAAAALACVLASARHASPLNASVSCRRGADQRAERSDGGGTRPGQGDGGAR